MPRRSTSDQYALSLTRVLGLTPLSGASLICSPINDNIFYPAGCAVIQYSPSENRQKEFFLANKAVCSICISKDGRFLAAGERGHQPTIIIWDLLKQEKVAALAGHKHGVGCISFSPNGKYLVSIGFKPDKQLILWDWTSGKKLSTQKLVNKVHSISFSADGEYFVTGGDRHLKWWYITEVLDGEAVGVDGKPASILEEHRLSVFVEIACGAHNHDRKVFCVTSSGLLCTFNSERVVEKWVQLESKSAYSLELFTADEAPGLLVVGCANGVIRAFAPKTLEYITTLPTPPPLNIRNEKDRTTSDEDILYGACYALRRVTASGANSIPKLSVVYADRTLIVWDISDIYSTTIYRSILSHRACIWDLQFVERTESGAAEGRALPPGSFVTCSADNSIRFWNLDQKQKKNEFVAPFSREIVSIVQLSEASDSNDQNVSVHDGRSLIASTATGISVANARGVVDFDFSAGIPDLEIPDRPQSAFFPRTLAIHPSGIELACGDKSGKLHIYDLRTMKLIKAIQAHSAEILSLSYSPHMITEDDGATWSVKAGAASDNSKDVILLASSGRDRLIHVFEATNNYCAIDTLDHHSSSVTTVRFTGDGKRLISCGGDKTMVFHNVSGTQISTFKSIQTPMGTINGLAVDASNKFVVTSGQDKRLNIWNVNSGKHMRAYKSSQISTELYKTDLDPSGSYIATCGFDKSICLIDFFSGEIVAQVTAHSELVTGVKFSPDGAYLYTIGGDSCIMVWKVADYFVRVMRDRLLELYSTAQKRNERAVTRLESSASSLSDSAAPAELAPAASLAHLKQRISRGTNSELDRSNISNSSSISVDFVRVSSNGDAAARKSKWGGAGESRDRDGSSGGGSAAAYELFGRKVVADKASAIPNRNKFTLELTSPVLTEKTWVNPNPSSASETERERGRERERERERESAHVAERRAADENAAIISEGNPTLAETAEDNDKVIHSVSSDEEEDDDGSSLFKGHHENYVSDYDAVNVASSGATSGANRDKAQADEDLGLAHTQNKLEHLEKSAQDLETWLESMLRNESKLDEGLVSGLSEQRPGVSDSIDLSRSLSAAYFSGNVRKSAVFQSNDGDGLMPPPPPQAQALSTPLQQQTDSEALVNERKLRESATAMTLMRERLRAMGVGSVDDSQPISPPAASTPIKLMPPPPGPSTGAKESIIHAMEEREGQGEAEAEDDLYRTPSTSSEDDQTAGLSIIPKSSEPAATVVLKQKVEVYHRVLKDLEAAKDRALNSFQELMQLRASMGDAEGLNESSVMPLSDDPSFLSKGPISETEFLLDQFRRSLSTFGGMSLEHTIASRLASSSVQNPASDKLTVSKMLQGTTSSDKLGTAEIPGDIAAILEKYSDRLVDLVGDKIVSKLSTTNSSVSSR